MWTKSCIALFCFSYAATFNIWHLILDAWVFPSTGNQFFSSWRALTCSYNLIWFWHCLELAWTQQIEDTVPGDSHNLRCQSLMRLLRLQPAIWRGYRSEVRDPSSVRLFPGTGRRAQEGVSLPSVVYYKAAPQEQPEGRAGCEGLVGRLPAFSAGLPTLPEPPCACQPESSPDPMLRDSDSGLIMWAWLIRSLGIGS